MIRLVIAVLLLLFSLLTVLRAPTNFLWLAAVAITSYCYVFMIAALLLLVSCCWAAQYKAISIVLTALAFILYSMPVLMAYRRGAGLGNQLEANFPIRSNAGMLPSPFSLGRMFGGIGIRPVTPQTFVYKHSSPKDLVIDFYAAPARQPAPCVIVVHGGSWKGGDNKQLPDLNSYLANRGYHVAAISYRLAPEYQCPAPVTDVKDALQFLTAKAGELGIDTSNFVLLGRSAGGQIALLAGYTFHDPRIRGIVSFYAPADMVWGATAPSNKWVLDTDKVLGDYVGGSYQDVPQKYEACSPLEFVDHHAPPTLIIHGRIDAMVAYEHSIHLQHKLEAAVVKYYFLDLPCATHGCDYNINGPDGQLTTFATERFIQSVTAKH